jgi:hypothetical protein
MVGLFFMALGCGATEVHELRASTAELTLEEPAVADRQPVDLLHESCQQEVSGHTVAMKNKLHTRVDCKKKVVETRAKHALAKLGGTGQAMQLLWYRHAAHVCDVAEESAWTDFKRAHSTNGSNRGLTTLRCMEARLHERMDELADFESGDAAAFHARLVEQAPFGADARQTLFEHARTLARVVNPAPVADPSTTKIASWRRVRLSDDLRSVIADAQRLATATCASWPALRQTSGPGCVSLTRDYYLSGYADGSFEGS